jgi:VWFA-related protein
VAGGPGARAETQQPPVFSAAVEVVRLDVIVLDRDGRPITGLGAGDFEVEEDGRPQAITSFEPIVVRGMAAPAAVEPPRLSASRLRAPQEGRTLFFFFDDIHVTPVVSEHVRRALLRFVETEVRDGDWVTLMAPDQGLWWTARNAWEYRQLPAVVGRLKGQLLRDPSPNAISDWEAIRVVEYGLPGLTGGSGVMAGQAASGIGSAAAPGPAGGDAAGGGPGAAAGGGPGGGAGPPSAGAGAVSGGSAGGGGNEPRMGVGTSDTSFLAEETVAVAKRRIRVTLDGLRQALESLLPLRGHKSLVLVSEGFVLLPQMPGYGELIGLARRANVAIHFVDPRGLQSGRTADAPGGPPAPFPGTTRDTDAAGADELSGATGGRAFVSNDPGVGLRQVAAESGAYYLLGYTPDRAGTGERKVRVRVKREDLKVRARSRYFVPEPEKGDKTAARKPSAAAPPPAVTAMRSLADTTELPVRTATLFFEANRQGEVATMLATEVVPPPGKTGARLFKLVSEARARDGGPAVHDQFEGSPDVRPGVPVILARQWHLPPGVWQARLLVEDTTTGHIGTALHTFEVPDPKAFRMSTPILTAEIDDPGGKRKPKVALGRTFRSGGVLYCQYSVYGAAAEKHDWTPHVRGSWVLRRGGELVREGMPTLIQPASDGRLTRTLGLSLEGAAAGDYSLTLTVRDEKTGQALTRTEAFTVAP